MSNFLIAVGFVVIAFIGSRIIALVQNKKDGDGAGYSKQRPVTQKTQKDDRSDLFIPRPSTLSQAAPTPPRFNSAFEEIDLTIYEHVAWLKLMRDPELWHVAVQAALAYSDDPHNFVPWVVQQQELDRSTGGWIFLWLEGSLYLKGENAFYHSFSGDDYINDVFSKLTSRSETMGFSQNSIGLGSGFEPERQKCLRLIAKGKVATGRMAPHNLLDAPYPPARAIRGIDNVEGVICF